MRVIIGLGIAACLLTLYACEPGGGGAAADRGSVCVHTLADPPGVFHC